MALERPHMGRLAAQEIVFIPVVTSRVDMGATIQRALQEIGEALQTQKVRAVGPWFAHYHRRPTNVFAFNICFPVGAKVEGTGRLQTASLPEIDVVRTAYHGPYEGLRTAWPEFNAWIEAKGYAVRGDFLEIYSIGLRDTQDPDTWQTDLVYPLLAGEAGKESLI